MSEVENEQARRQELIKKFGNSPPPLGRRLSYPKLPPTGYALIVSHEHTTIDENNHIVYVGICPKVGWVTTRVEPDADRGG